MCIRYLTLARDLLSIPTPLFLLTAKTRCCNVCTESSEESSSLYPAPIDASIMIYCRRPSPPNSSRSSRILEKILHFGSRRQASHYGREQCGRAGERSSAAVLQLMAHCLLRRRSANAACCSSTFRTERHKNETADYFPFIFMCIVPPSACLPSPTATRYASMYCIPDH